MSFARLPLPWQSSAPLPGIASGWIEGCPGSGRTPSGWVQRDQLLHQADCVQPVLNSHCHVILHHELIDLGRMGIFLPDQFQLFFRFLSRCQVGTAPGSMGQSAP